MAARDFTLGTMLASQVGFRLGGGPWWAGFLLVALGLVALCLRTVFPQDSPDRLAWWRDRWGTRRLGRSTISIP